MNTLYGITGIAVKAIETCENDMDEVNSFLAEYDGNIINIQPVPMLYGWTRFVITYKAREDT